MNTNNSIYVGNLVNKILVDELYELFIQFGNIKDIRYPRDKVTQLYQGFAFIEYYNENERDYVIKLFGEEEENNNNYQ